MMVTPFTPMGEAPNGVFVRLPAFEPIPPLHEPDGTVVDAWRISRRSCAQRFKVIVAYGRSYLGFRGDVPEATFRATADQAARAEAVVAAIVRHEARRFGVRVSGTELEWGVATSNFNAPSSRGVVEMLKAEGDKTTLRDLVETNLLRRKLPAAMFVVLPPPRGRGEIPRAMQDSREEMLRERAFSNFLLQRERQLPCVVVTP